MGKIIVSGTGVVSQEPDVADVSFTVTSEGARPSIAVGENAKKMKALIKVAEDYKIESKDRKTTGWGNNPIYDNPPIAKAGQKQKEPKIIGYRSHNTITVRLSDVEKLGEFLSALAAAGAMQLATQYDIGDKSKLEKQAREKAFYDAEAKAKAYAKFSGTKLGKVQSISESARWGNGNLGGGARFAKAAVTESVMFDATPMEAGEQSVTVSVNAEFAIR